MNIVSTKNPEQPYRIIVYGDGGVGKSTLASASDAPIFIAAEDGLSCIDAKALERPKSWTDVLSSVDALRTSAHSFKTLVIDSLDWLEPFCWAHVCAKHRKTDIEAFGYGKGYITALYEWRVLLAALERLQDERKMHVLMIAHGIIRTLRNPEGEDFSKWGLKLNDRAAALLVEWSSAQLWACFEQLVTTNDAGRTKGVQGERILRCVSGNGYQAKNRYGMPPKIRMDWKALEAAMKGTSK